MAALSRLVVAMLTVREGRVLMVCQPGVADSALCWSAPGGVVEAGESMHDTLVREVAEETGLTVVRLTRLLFVAQFPMGGGDWPGMWTVFTFDAHVHGEIGCDDPDGLVREAAWVPIDEALRRLSRQRFAPIREPAVRYLVDSYLVDSPVSATMWTWPRGVDAEPVVVPAAPPFEFQTVVAAADR